MGTGRELTISSFVIAVLLCLPRATVAADFEQVPSPQDADSASPKVTTYPATGITSPVCDWLTPCPSACECCCSVAVGESRVIRFDGQIGAPMASSWRCTVEKLFPGKAARCDFCGVIKEVDDAIDAANQLLKVRVSKTNQSAQQFFSELYTKYLLLETAVTLARNNAQIVCECRTNCPEAENCKEAKAALEKAAKIVIRLEPTGPDLSNWPGGCNWRKLMHDLTNATSKLCDAQKAMPDIVSVGSGLVITGKAEGACTVAVAMAHAHTGATLLYTIHVNVQPATTPLVFGTIPCGGGTRCCLRHH